MEGLYRKEGGAEGLSGRKKKRWFLVQDIFLEKENARVLSPRLTLAGGGEGVVERAQTTSSMLRLRFLRRSSEPADKSWLAVMGCGGGSGSIWGLSFHN